MLFLVLVRTVQYGCASLGIILLLLQGFVLVILHMCTCVHAHRIISHGNDGIICFLAYRVKDYTKASLVARKPYI